MELILIRHGRPGIQHSAAGADPGLAPTGVAQAELLGRLLAAEPALTPTALYTSPMRRAVETATAIAAHTGLGLQVEGRLAEFDSGAESYVPLELSKQDRAEQWRALETGVWGSHRFDPDLFEDRVAAAFTDIVDAHPSATVAVVCHGGVINSYLGRVLGRPRGMFVQPEYTSLSRVAVARSGHRQLRSLNETPHLRSAAVEARQAADRTTANQTTSIPNGGAP